MIAATKLGALLVIAALLDVSQVAHVPGTPAAADHTAANDTAANDTAADHTSWASSRPNQRAYLPARASAIATGHVSSTAIVAAFNRVRAANGLPPVKEDAAWDGACRLHEIYESDNDIETHYEISGKPGYSALGAWAGRNAVLAEAYGVGGNPVWTGADPWATAPIHLSQMMSPALGSIGAYQWTDSHGVTWNCLTTWPGYATGHVLHTKSQRLWSYPGDGSTGVPTEIQSAENPTVPNGWVGLPTQGATYGGVTGPFIYLYWSGPSAGAEICTNNPKFDMCVSGDFAGVEAPVAASLHKPDGAAVDTRLISQAVISRAGYSGYIPYDSAMLVPVYPLKPHTTYTVHVAFGAFSSFPCPMAPAGSGVSLSRNWCLPKYAPFSTTMHFTTAPA